MLREAVRDLNAGILLEWLAVISQQGITGSPNTSLQSGM